MKWFQKKNKEPQIFISYVPLDAALYLKTTNPKRMVEINPNSVFPFFIKLTEEPFKNWVIELTEIEETSGTVSFGTVIDLVPKDITDKQVKKLKPQLNVLLSKIINDIINNALGRADATVPKVITDSVSEKNK